LIVEMFEKRALGTPFWRAWAAAMALQIPQNPQIQQKRAAVDSLHRRARWPEALDPE
jgi:hypothetical protein